MGNMKILLFLLLVIFIGCFPDHSKYERIIDETMMAVSGWIQPGDSIHYIHVERLHECLSHGGYDDCEDADVHTGFGIDSALVHITIRDSVYMGVGAQIPQYYRYYATQFRAYPGDTIELMVSHPDYESVWALAIVPSDIIVNQINEIVNENAVLDFEWPDSENAVGFDSHLYLIGKKDTIVYRYQISDGWDERPNKRKSYSQKLGNVLEQITSLSFDTDEIIDNSDSLFLQLDVWLLDEAYYNTMLSLYGLKEEYSGFSAPLTQYSNIENGVGVFGAYWISRSAFIDVTGYLK